MDNNQTIQQIESQVAELHRQAERRMTARYDEFEHFDADYPDGCIGDPESLVNEALVGAYSRVLRIIRGK
tara:strand:- start:1069 stop:1278 length:210 start_codon:yes stop_codon:yes gene_type:complete